MTSRSQNPELYRNADNALRVYSEILRRHGIDGETSRRIHNNASSWTIRRFGKVGQLLLATDLVHSELVGRSTGIWHDKLESAIRSARETAVGLINAGSAAAPRSHRELLFDLYCWANDCTVTFCPAYPSLA